MNLEELSDQSGLEYEEYMELVELFIETGRADLKSLLSAIHEADAKKVADIAHSLKGAAITLELTEFIIIAKEIEASARNGELDKSAITGRTLGEKLDRLADILMACIFIKG